MSADSFSSALKVDSKEEKDGYVSYSIHLSALAWHLGQESRHERRSRHLGPEMRILTEIQDLALKGQK